MSAAAKQQYYIPYGDKPIETYTLKEAAEIARRLVQETGQKIMVTDSQGRPKMRVFPHQGEAYVDYYLTDRIAQSEMICHGKSRIASGRIMVYLILDLLAEGLTIEEIVSPAYYPDLTREDVLACIEFASRLLKNDVAVPA